MKIAVLAGKSGEKALYLYDFFKEGNRLSFVCLLTTSPDSEAAVLFAREGIKVITVSEGDSTTNIADYLKDQEVELIVDDDFEGDFPEKLKEASSIPMITLSSKENGPLEVIEANKKINAAFASHPETEKKEEKPESTEVKSGTAVNPPSEQEKEWADVLNVDLNDVSKAQDITSEVSDIQQQQNSQSENSQGNPETQHPVGTPPRPQEDSRQNSQRPQMFFGFPQQSQNPNQQQYGQQQRAFGNVGQQQGPEQEPMPKTYLVWSVIITILCCLIPGIVAIVYSASVSSKYYAGNIEGAKKASRNAQIWCIISVVAGILWTTLYLPLSLLAE